MQSKECQHPVENAKSFPVRSNMTGYDEIKKNLRTVKKVMWSVMHVVHDSRKSKLLFQTLFFCVSNFKLRSVSVEACPCYKKSKKEAISKGSRPRQSSH